MGTTSGGAAGPGKPQLRRGTGLRRAMAAAWLVVIGVVVEQGAQGLFSGQSPAFLTWLGSVVSLQGDRPLWLKLLSLLAVVIVVAALGWLTYLAWRANQNDNDTPTPAQSGIAIAGSMSGGTVVQGDHPIVVSGAQQVTIMQPPQPVQGPPATPPTISAPSGLPRAVAFVGRAQVLADLLAELRTGGAVGVFALSGMGGVGKTALAAEAVYALAQEAQTFPAGAAWVACEDLRGQEGLAEVWTRVARALDAAEIAALPDAEQRRGALHGLLARGARRLLALDNVDALPAGPLLSTLAVQGHTTLLLTARQVIDGSEGEPNRKYLFSAKCSPTSCLIKRQ